MAGERTLSTLKRYRELYSKANRKERGRLLDEFCELTQYHRKYAINLLRKRADTAAPGSPQTQAGAGVFGGMHDGIGEDVGCRGASLAGAA
ncbi:MAG: hypothetical protein ACLFV4_13125 [Candidatus Hydrogenedentota bacterium]